MRPRSVVLLVLGTLLAGALGAAAVVAFTAEDDVTTGSTTTAPDGATPTSATTSATAPGASSALTIVTSDAGLLGWWDGARWVQAEAEGTTPVAGGEEYSIVGIDGPPAKSTGGKAEPPSETCSTPSIVLDPPAPATVSVPGIRVHGVAAPQPRPSTLLDPDAPVYRDAARAEVAKLGLPGDDVRVVQVVRTDLSGDGTDEVLVVAEHLSAPDTLIGAPGDYSVVLLRQIVDGEVETTIVTESRADPDQSGPFILVSRVAAVADLNGDGTMEVAVQDSYYEGVGMSAYELSPQGRLNEILHAACGA